LRHPTRVGSLALYGTWAKADRFGIAMLTALRSAWALGDLAAALTSLGIAYSPELLSSPSFDAAVQQALPHLPSRPEQMRVVVEQFDADLAHDSHDRLADVVVPTLVLAGEQDLIAPPWAGRAVADAIPGARFALLTGAGSSHAMLWERTPEVLGLILEFLSQHPL
jgi:pimeloyl-ACP methyl ester carboxylesterase